MATLMCCMLLTGCQLLEKLGMVESDEHKHEFEFIEEKDATCTDIGGKVYKCECGVIQMSDVVEALGHDIVDHDGKDATCTEKGYQPYETCERCDYTSYVELPFTNHVYDKITVVEPTATSEGYTKHICECGDYYIDSYVDPLEKAPELSYVLASDGSGYIVTGQFESRKKDLVIPDTYNDLPVIGIYSYAFQYDTVLETVSIPDSVTYIDEYAFYSCSNLRAVYVGENSKITYIAKKAFSYDSALIEISLPSELVSIGHEAFGYCSSLTEISIPATVVDIGENAFAYCDKLVRFEIADGSKLEVIGKYAFTHCMSLLDISLPDSLTSLGKGAFNYCEDLKSVRVGRGVDRIETGVFNECHSLNEVIIPKSVVYIDEYAFYDSCGNLAVYYEGAYSDWQKIDFGYYSLNDIRLATVYYYSESDPDKDGNYWYYSKTGEIRFWGIYYEDEWDDNTGNDGGESGDGGYDYNDPDVTTLTYELSDDGTYYIVTGFVIIYGYEFTVPAEVDGLPVREIADDAFWGLSVITTVTLPDSIEVIGEYAFASCDDLRTIHLGSGLTTIKDEAFYSCVSLSSIDLPDSLTYIGKRAFMGCWSLGEVVIPDGVTSIADETFLSCRNLKKVVLPDNLVSIGKSAFSTCSLTSVSIPDGVVAIGDDAFSCNTGLGYIYLGMGVKTIGKDAFAVCTGLKYVYYVGTEEQYASINIASGNDMLTDAYVYYESV